MRNVWRNESENFVVSFLIRFGYHNKKVVKININRRESKWEHNIKQEENVNVGKDGSRGKKPRLK